jgi:ABC-type amino acid transport substrate-binding protein
MRHIAALLLTVAMVAGLAPLATATATLPVLTEPTLEKISRTGVLVIGTRTSSPPFACAFRPS